MTSKSRLDCGAADGWQVTVRLAELGRDHGGTAQWPLTPDGSRYLHSVAGGLLRPGDAVFGTTNAAVLDAVIPGYTRLTPDERATARLQHAVGVHRQLGFELLAEHGDTLTPQAVDLLTAANLLASATPWIGLMLQPRKVS